MYIATNWNLQLALFVSYHEIKGERKYHLRTTGFDELKHLETSGIDTRHSSMYMPVNYYVLEKLMQQAAMLPHNGTFLDLGAGKGRPLIVAAHYGFTKITGVDFSHRFCSDMKITVVQQQPRFPLVQFSIVQADAFDYPIPDEVTMIFLYNPFDEVIMRGVLDNIEDSLQQKARTIWILYANPVCQHLFIDAGFKVIYHIKKTACIEGIILQKRMGF